MIISNPDEQVWNMLTNGAGASPGRLEMDRLKVFLKEQNIFFVVDHDDRYHWIRLRSRRDLQIIQVKADVMVQGDAAKLDVRYAGNVHTGLSAEEARDLVVQYYKA